MIFFSLLDLDGAIFVIMFCLCLSCICLMFFHVYFVVLYEFFVSLLEIRVRVLFRENIIIWCKFRKNSKIGFPKVIYDMKKILTFNRKSSPSPLGSAYTIANLTHIYTAVFSFNLEIDL